MVRHDMNRTEWENTAKEFNLYDDKTLMDYHCDGMNVVYIVGMILDFFGNVSLPKDYQTQINHCISDITAICADIAHQLNPDSDDLNMVELFGYLSHTTLFSPALDDLFANIAQANPQPLPTPAVRQRTLELLSLHLAMKYFSSRFYEQKQPFYALCLANKSLEVLGGAKQLYGLSQNRILKFGLLSDNDKASIHKQIQQEQGKQHALKATEHKRQERARLGQKYLNIMTKQGFTSYAQTVRHIFQYDNQENKTYEWIESVLKQADKDRKERPTAQIE